jgi:hypothetical protein
MSENISKYRSEVIEKSINVEWLINAIISQHYFKKVLLPFVFDFLYDINCTFALKRNILEKIDSNFYKYGEKLNRLNNIRNLFAHCNQKIININNPEGKIYDPKNTTKVLDFESLYNEFISSEKNVTQDLFNTFLSLG